MRGHDNRKACDGLFKEQLHILLEREASYRGCSSGQTNTSGEKDMPRQHSQWRPKICEWCYRVVDHFEYDRQVVYIAMEYFDRFLCIYPGTSDLTSRMYQLAAMTCLYMAMKIHANTLSQRHVTRGEENLESPHEFRRRCVRLSAYVELSRGQFYPHDVERMEGIILATLEWKMNPITPMCFVSYFLMLIPSTPSWSLTKPLQPYQLTIQNFINPLHYDSKELVLHVLHELSRYLTELAIICLPDLAFTSTSSPPSSKRGTFKPSVIAYSAILLSMDIISFHSDLNETVRHEFIQELAHLSVHDEDCSSPSSQDYIPNLHPNHPDVLRLKRIIQDSFIPEMVLEQAFSSSQQDMCHSPCFSSLHSNQGQFHVDQIHPIIIAKEAGILNLGYVQNIPCNQTMASNDELDRTVHDPKIKRDIVKNKTFSPTSVVLGTARS